jgi:hypothetical protein
VGLELVSCLLLVRLCIAFAYLQHTLREQDHMRAVAFLAHARVSLLEIPVAHLQQFAPPRSALQAHREDGESAQANPVGAPFERSEQFADLVFAERVWGRFGSSDGFLAPERHLGR